MNPSERYFRARENAGKHGGNVPTELLRGHFDYQRGLRQVVGGLHPVVVTVTKNATKETLDLVPAINRPEVVIRLEGQKFEENVI